MTDRPEISGTIIRHKETSPHIQETIELLSQEALREVQALAVGMPRIGLDNTPRDILRAADAQKAALGALAFDKAIAAIARTVTPIEHTTDRNSTIESVAALLSKAGIRLNNDKGRG